MGPRRQNATMLGATALTSRLWTRVNCNGSLGRKTGRVYMWRLFENTKTNVGKQDTMAQKLCVVRSC